MLESERIMFEIYKEGGYHERGYDVVYYTELDDHDKETEINRAMAGEHFYNGFIKEFKKEEAKRIIERIIERLNNGEEVDPKDVDSELAEYIP